MIVIDPTKMAEHTTRPFLQQSSLSEVCQQLCPQGLRTLRLYKLPKIQKEVLLGPTVSNFRAPTYQPSKNLADSLTLMGNSSKLMMKSSTEFVHNT